MPAKTFLSNVIQTLLPGVVRGLEQLMIKNNESGGMPVGVEEKTQKPSYRLHLVRSDKKRLKAGEIFKKFTVEVRELHATDAADSGDCSRLPPDIRAKAHEVLRIDIKVAIDVDFNTHADGDCEILVQLRSESWFSPSIGVGMDTLHIAAHIRIWCGLALNDILVAFHEEPDVTWDVEATLTTLEIPLPDNVEDRFLAWSVRKVLSWFHLDNPLVIPVQTVEEDIRVVEDAMDENDRGKNTSVAVV